MDPNIGSLVIKVNILPADMQIISSTRIVV